LLSDNSVEMVRSFSGDGDDCDQLWFSCVKEALVEALERGVVAGGDQSAHEEGGAHLRPPAADEAFAFPLSGLTHPGRKPDQACDFAPVEPAELGQFGDQGARDVGPTPGTEASKSSFSRQAGEPRTASSMSVSRLESSFCSAASRRAMLFCRRFSIRRFCRWRPATIIWTI
jgi:hypothetical protein